MQDADDTLEYIVLVNGEKQYSLWRADLAIPEGWSATGPRGTKSVCLDHVKSVWTDMRPLSLQTAMSATN